MRDAIRASGLTQHELCKQTGIDQGLMSRFMHGKSMLSLRAVDRVAAVLDWHICCSAIHPS